MDDSPEITIEQASRRVLLDDGAYGIALFSGNMDAALASALPAAQT